MPGVKRRIGKAKSRAGQLRHVLNSTELALDLKLRLYIAVCCSIMTYGAEVWLLDERARRALNGANTYAVTYNRQPKKTRIDSRHMHVQPGAVDKS